MKKVRVNFPGANFELAGCIQRRYRGVILVDILIAIGVTCIATALLMALTGSATVSYDMDRC